MICGLTDFSLQTVGSTARTPFPCPLVSRTYGSSFLGSGRTAVLSGQTSLRVARTLSFYAGRGRGQLTVRAGTYEEFPFKADDYNRVALHIVSAPSEPRDMPAGQLILMRQQLNGLPPEDDQKGLVLGVSGDTLLAVTAQAQGRDSARPLSLDLLWQVLQRGMETDRPKWQLLRVAIVELRGFTYIGRAFFGDRETGKVAWDCDCRPSDSVWLAQKTHAPIFVHKQIWENHSVQLGSVEKDQFQAHLRQKQALQEIKLKMEQHFSLLPDQNTYIRHDDPDPVKRLKREMQVALKEEDYVAAVRIRDHPFMKLSREILNQQAQGNQEGAIMLQNELQQAINQSLQPSQSQSV